MILEIQKHILFYLNYVIGIRYFIRYNFLTDKNVITIVIRRTQDTEQHSVEH